MSVYLLFLLWQKDPHIELFSKIILKIPAVYMLPKFRTGVYDRACQHTLHFLCNYISCIFLFSIQLQSRSQSLQASWSVGDRWESLGYWNFYRRTPAVTRS